MLPGGTASKLVTAQRSVVLVGVVDTISALAPVAAALGAVTVVVAAGRFHS